jgi:hypothetical protein
MSVKQSNETVEQMSFLKSEDTNSTVSNIQQDSGNVQQNSGTEQSQDSKAPTYEELNEMILSGDIERVREAERILAEMEKGEIVQPYNSSSDSNDDDNTHNIETTDKSEKDNGTKDGKDTEEQSIEKTPLSVYYGGVEYKFDDPDGYMGFKSLDALKKSWAHKEAFIQQLKSEAHSARDEVAKLKDENERLKRELEDVKNNRVTTDEHNNNGVTDSVNDLELPQRPDVPVDPTLWTDEDAAAMEEYERKRDEVIKRLIEMKTVQPQNVEVSIPDEYKQLLETIKKKEEDLKRYEEEKKYWDGIESFRKMHKEYATVGKDIVTLDKEIRQWLDRLADAAGYYLLPNSTPEAIQQREAIKQQLFDAYLNGDPNVTSLGVVPPDGYMDYVKLANLDAKRQEFIANGLLGNNATLHDAWVLLQDKEGVFDKTLSKLEADAKAKGVKSVVNTLQQQDNVAKTIPNEYGSGDGNVEITQDLIQKAVNASPAELAQNPVLREALKKAVNGEF